MPRVSMLIRKLFVVTLSVGLLLTPCVGDDNVKAAAEPRGKPPHPLATYVVHYGQAVIEIRLERTNHHSAILQFQKMVSEFRNNTNRMDKLESRLEDQLHSEDDVKKYLASYQQELLDADLKHVVETIDAKSFAYARSEWHLPCPFWCAE